MQIGTVQSLWRYPVKSMQGENLTAVQVGPLGVAGDRGYAVRDEHAGEIRGAKKLPGLLHFSARYLQPPTETDIPPAEVTLPDGKTVRTDHPDINAWISRALGRDVTLWSRQPAENVEHYRRAAREIDDLRRVLGLEEGEEIPPLEGLPSDLMHYVSPLGTYFDAYPLHLLTTASLRTLSAHHPGGQFTPERFRPNIFIATADSVGRRDETTWKGRVVRLGEVELLVRAPTIRCVMTTLPQGVLPKDPRILRTIVEHTAHHLGVYATVNRPGQIRVGDPVELIT